MRCAWECRAAESVSTRGTTKARYRYGLYTRPKRGEAAAESLVAVASFSARWRKRVADSDQRRSSHELIRYCSRRGESVTGGISKLLAAFRRDAQPDERYDD